MRKRQAARDAPLKIETQNLVSAKQRDVLVPCDRQVQRAFSDTTKVN